MESALPAMSPGATNDGPRCVPTAVAASRFLASVHRCVRSDYLYLGRVLLGGLLMARVLTFKNLTLGYDKQPAVRDLCTSVASGSLTAIVGPNGAGKSTLLKGVTGALSPMKGGIALEALNQSDIAYLPQQSEIDQSFPLSVTDLVSMGLWRQTGIFGKFRAEQRNQITQAIAAVGLKGFENRAIGTLSGGQMQRALFARLLLQNAQLVLLDEPFTAIDARTMADLLAIIGRWHGEGRTVVAVLHDFEVVKAHFPETLMLARELVAHGPTNKVLTSENHFRARQMCEACEGPPHTCGRSVA